ncbi:MULTISPECIES: mannose-1-phosphate guanylyltransferase/mannose-6-phosphate isomerase [Chromobacteriaceae]|uniref:mannose-1-phosphate guanylyltransferase/mannose-6-phosphate isomerase n=1 Tax=Chromobacteriaceae TaxID=1499392 RepID=UPI000410AA50|nr:MULTISPECIES: mannose-1-phosphate guanylyltransferase/mannose-6-phosphate isomerase [Chromobacteriaceae]AVG14641.1 mannose-1-phosphate guanylyltransferase/mannose-6-phosphate isomerase [Chromobacterium vaccinii]
MPKITPVILCGGSGTRLWPLSRSGFPKQFLSLTGNESLFQQATLRLDCLKIPDSKLTPPLIVCNEEHRFLAMEQLREINLDAYHILLEPTPRNTAPALTIAALQALQDNEDPILIVTPADQVIQDQNIFEQAIDHAVQAAASGAIAILGISPDRPETGYGYIKSLHSSSDEEHLHSVECFVEKPNAVLAQQYLDEGGYFWNAGIFVLKASTWLNALQHFRPDIHKQTQHAWNNKTVDAVFIRPDKNEFNAVPSESIDYSVMEHCPGSPFAIQMIPLRAGWSDLGSWDAVWDILEKDESGNALSGDVLATNSHNTLVQATSRLVSLVGVKDLIVIETPDAILIADKKCSQDVKSIVSKLNEQKREELALHRKVHRPWGWYDCIDEGGRFKVKRIMVKPKASLSLQMHHHRAEHWIVVKGSAEVTNGDKKILLSENESTYIPIGQTHRLVNPGMIPLELIEVQSGSYLGEDDIIRITDDYNRH